METRGSPPSRHTNHQGLSVSGGRRNLHLRWWLRRKLYRSTRYRLALSRPGRGRAGRKVEQLFSNLIGNALKFTKDEQPLVKVGVRSVENGVATFYVQDNGIGIGPEYHERVFGIFQRLHRREDYEGTGAGLSIVKRVVEAHGGRIWVESVVGQGSTFSFAIPNSAQRSEDMRSAKAA